MRINLKRTVTIVILTIISIILFSCSSRKEYVFSWSHSEYLKMLQENHKGMHFIEYGMSFYGPDYYAHAIVALDGIYETYTLHNISFEWDSNKIVYEINKKNKLNYEKSKVYDSDEYIKHAGINIPEVTKWYEIDYLEGFPVIDFSKIFKDKKVGEEFYCKITINFSFDDEAQMTLSYNSRIRVISYSIFGRKMMTMFP